ncbi:hypothetical protein [Ramlibacter sp. WS9]|uniref:hypothetical protein n=1 Tax=Ramlibacter sp. WS9 TaxID=1882741 RepID=UPI0013052A39|nr:hypothetical protein [Ramlibacter sp. WS9]
MDTAGIHRTCFDLLVFAGLAEFDFLGRSLEGFAVDIVSIRFLGGKPGYGQK